MLAYLRIAPFVLFLFLVKGEVYGQFSGGDSDGHANRRLVNSICAITTLNPFAGGAADGHTNARLINAVCAITTLNPFMGGASDGHSNAKLVNSACAITTLNPFAGGISDGHANARLTNSVCAITTINPFAGGIADGHANARIVNSVCAITTINPFAGGVSDGHANGRLVNSTCAITTVNPFAGGESDGSGNVRMVNVLPSVCIPTPIRLLSFIGDCIEDKVELHWSTAIETNNDYFTIERGLSSDNLKTIGTLKGAGNSSQLVSYTYTDAYPIAGQGTVAYYRLRQTDVDGKTETFQTIAVQTCEGSGRRIKLLPNPTNGLFTITYNGNQDEVMATEVVSVISEQVFEQAGLQSTIDLSFCAAGVYVVNIKTNSGLIYEKIVLTK